MPRSSVRDESVIPERLDEYLFGAAVVRYFWTPVIVEVVPPQDLFARRRLVCYYERVIPPPLYSFKSKIFSGFMIEEILMKMVEAVC